MTCSTKFWSARLGTLKYTGYFKKMMGPLTHSIFIFSHPSPRQADRRPSSCSNASHPKPPPESPVPRSRRGRPILPAPSQAAAAAAPHSTACELCVGSTVQDILQLPPLLQIWKASTFTSSANARGSFTEGRLSRFSAVIFVDWQHITLISFPVSHADAPFSCTCSRTGNGNGRVRVRTISHRSNLICMLDLLKMFQ
jgi:hypothetical protein